ncbi:MAG: hypothetical protein R3C68_17455 [Myxococcota bacterium]
MDVTLSPGPGQDLANRLGIDIGQLNTLIRNEVEQVFGLVDTKSYLTAMGDAQAFAGKGLGVDYASNPTKFVVGVGAGFAVALGDRGLDELNEESPIVGAAPNISLMAGMNLGILGAEDVTVYMNAFRYSTTYRGLHTKLRNFGVHGQVKLFRPEDDLSDLLVQWGGLDLTTGIVRARTNYSLKRHTRYSATVGDGCIRG